MGLCGKKTNPQQLLSLLLLMLFFSLCYVRKGVTVYEVRFQEETARGIGVIRSSLRGKRINRNGLFTEVTAKRRATERVEEVKR